jgi:NADH-quinone oxidoreductase subunit C
MTPAELAGRLGEVLPAGDVAVAHGAVTATVDRRGWRDAVAAVRDDDVLDGRFFDVLLGTDLGDGTGARTAATGGAGLELLVRLWSVRHRHAVHLRTTCPHDDPHVPSLTAVFAGAAWREREVAEMLGVVFDGHPGLVPLLLPDGFPGHPLRKAFVLADRLAAAWPGSVEPGESRPNPRRVPPGVPPAGRGR